MEKFNLRKLSELEVRELCQIKTSNSFSIDSEDMSRPGENINRVSAKDSLGLYEQKQAKVCWLQDPNQTNVCNKNNVGC